MGRGFDGETITLLVPVPVSVREYLEDSFFVIGGGIAGRRAFGTPARAPTGGATVKSHHFRGGMLQKGELCPGYGENSIRRSMMGL